MQEKSTAAFPDADAAYGLPLADALRGFSKAGINAEVDRCLAAWRAAGGRCVGSLILKRQPFCDFETRDAPGGVEMRAALRLRRAHFHELLRRGELQASFTADPVEGVWQQWRPEAWDHLQILEYVTEPTVVFVCSRTSGKIFGWVRVREVPVSATTMTMEAISGETAATASPPKAKTKAKASAKSPKGERELKAWIAGRYREGIRMRRKEWLSAAIAATGVNISESRFVRHVLPALKEQCPDLVPRGAPPGNSRKSVHQVCKSPVVVRKK